MEGLQREKRMTWLAGGGEGGKGKLGNIKS